MTKPILCVDFDGVIHSYKSGWQGPRKISDEPVPGALEWLRRTYEEGKFDVAIYSSRSKALFGRAAMKNWLRVWLVEEFGYMAGPGMDPLYDELLHWLKFPAKKPAAFLTIDDRAHCFDGDWSKLTAGAMFAFKPWNKRPSAA